MTSLSDHSDFLDRAGAQAIAASINDYWRARGHLTVRAEPYELPDFRRVYGVRSNLVGGLPPRPQRQVFR